MSRTGSQQRTLLGILVRLRPHWRRDTALPARIEAVLRADRRLGSRDRRLYRELVYTALRYLPWIEPELASDLNEAVRRLAWLAADSPAVRTFREAVARGMAECPPSADEKARVLGCPVEQLTPVWLREECPEAAVPPLRDALLSRAPLWLRIQSGEPEKVLSEFRDLGWNWRHSALAKGAIALEPGTDVSRTRAYLEGRIEVQDIGSQRVLGAVSVHAGGQWLDACAGAGGKALQLAALVGPSGVVHARDARPEALLELSARAQRAGVGSRIRVGPGPDPRTGYDGVLVDVPCTGSGTWRRSPHLRWVTSADSVRAASRIQRGILRANAGLVAPGGLLVYATCSLCRSENEEVVASFLRENREFRPDLKGLRLLPQEHDGDGFFVASLRRE